MRPVLLVLLLALAGCAASPDAGRIDAPIQGGPAQPELLRTPETRLTLRRSDDFIPRDWFGGVDRRADGTDVYVETVTDGEAYVELRETAEPRFPRKAGRQDFLADHAGRGFAIDAETLSLGPPVQTALVRGTDGRCVAFRRGFGEQQTTEAVVTGVFCTRAARGADAARAAAFAFANEIRHRPYFR